MTLAEFLLARIAEDEDLAHESTEHGTDRFGSPHQARWWPPRVLAECDAKRRIVEVCEADERRDTYGTGSRVMQLLALPYADHPDYREEWRP